MKYRKKPVVIDAVQWSGSNWHEILDFAGKENVYVTGADLHVVTLEGPLNASPDDWIIKGIKGEFYPCKPDVFEATYEKEPEPLPFDPKFPNHVEGCICPRFKDIAPDLIADLTCPVHGVNGTDPGDKLSDR